MKTSKEDVEKKVLLSVLVVYVAVSVLTGTDMADTLYLHTDEGDIMQNITIGRTEYLLTIENMTDKAGDPFEYVSMTGKRGAEYHVVPLHVHKDDGLYRAYSFGSFRDVKSPNTGRPAILQRVGNEFTFVK